MQHLGIENPIENLTVSEYAIIPLQMSLEECHRKLNIMK